jgi:hypothetical protein
MKQKVLKSVFIDTRAYILAQALIFAGSAAANVTFASMSGWLSQADEDLIFGLPFILMALCRSIIGMNFERWISVAHFIAIVVGYFYTDIIGFVATNLNMPSLVMPLLITSYITIIIGVIITIRGFFPPVAANP